MGKIKKKQSTSLMSYEQKALEILNVTDYWVKFDYSLNNTFKINYIK